MAEQSAAGTIGDTGARAESSEAHAGYHGRTASWVCTTVVVIGFVVGGIALPVGPVWWLFWTGVGIVVLGGIIGAFAHIFDDWY